MHTDLADHVSEARLSALIANLARFGERSDGGVDRQALTGAEIDARAFLAERAAELGCRVSIDAAGNMFMRREGTEALDPVVTGSHIDTQPAGGKLDGAYGICAGLEVIAAFNDAGIRTRHPLEVVAWSNEEGCRFAPGSLGAQAYVAPHRLELLLAARDAQGARYADELASMRRALPGAGDHRLGAPMHVFMEAHIEQGPVLEQNGTPVGIVSGVQGVRWLQIHAEGRASHAGTTPLALRRDAMRAVTAVLVSLYELAERTPDLRLTVGRVDVQPGSINTVPGEVSITVDLRHPDGSLLDACEARLRDLCATVRHGCSFSVETLMTLPTTSFDADVRASLRDAATSLGLRATDIVSGAFHDSVHLAGHCRTAMLFVPSRDGLSHHPAEHTDSSLLVDGARVLAVALAHHCQASSRQS
jgi:N-carbamoyl-L-amino-acid hydrolase